MSNENNMAQAPVERLVGHLRELMEAATHRHPWILNEWKTEDYLDDIVVDANANTSIGSVFWADKPEARLIVAAINALPVLLAIAEASYGFQRGQSWACAEWKAQPHIKALYDALSLPPNTSDQRADKETSHGK